VPLNANPAVWILFVLLCDYYSIQLWKLRPIRYEKRCYSDMRSKAYMSEIIIIIGESLRRPATAADAAAIWRHRVVSVRKLSGRSSSLWGMQMVWSINEPVYGLQHLVCCRPDFKRREGIDLICKALNWILKVTKFQYHRHTMVIRCSFPSWSFLVKTTADDKWAFW